MTDIDAAALQEELENFKREKEKIRNQIGAIGGAIVSKKDKIINLCFVIAIIILLLTDIMRHMLNLKIPLPPLFSIEIGILIVSVKIIWMIKKQTKVEHFQFWILNSIEFRLNNISRRIDKIEKLMDNK
jgi:uncharacterized membrane protein